MAAQAIRNVPGGGKVFAGQADDPFFVDLGTAFDAINLRNGTGNAGSGKDDLAGYGVHTFDDRLEDLTVAGLDARAGGPRDHRVGGVYAGVVHGAAKALAGGIRITQRSSPRRSVALVSPSVTYAPNRPSLITIGLPVALA